MKDDVDPQVKHFRFRAIASPVVLARNAVMLQPFEVCATSMTGPTTSSCWKLTTSATTRSRYRY